MSEWIDLCSLRRRGNVLYTHQNENSGSPCSKLTPTSSYTCIQEARFLVENGSQQYFGTVLREQIEIVHFIAKGMGTAGCGVCARRCCDGSSDDDMGTCTPRSVKASENCFLQTVSAIPAGKIYDGVAGMVDRSQE